MLVFLVQFVQRVAHLTEILITEQSTLQNWIQAMLIDQLTQLQLILSVLWTQIQDLQLHNL